MCHYDDALALSGLHPTAQAAVSGNIIKPAPVCKNFAEVLVALVISRMHNRLNS